MKKNTKHYAQILAEKYDLPIDKVNQLLLHSAKNICHAILTGKDIRIPKFGHIFKNKNKFNYVKRQPIPKK